MNEPVATSAPVENVPPVTATVPLAAIVVVLVTSSDLPGVRLNNGPNELDGATVRPPAPVICRVPELKARLRLDGASSSIDPVRNWPPLSVSVVVPPSG